MTMTYPQMAASVAADLRAEGCTASITVTASNRHAQPKWARQELAGRILLKRDVDDRLPSEDRLSYEQSINTLIMYADVALGLIVKRGPDTSKMIYRVMSYHTHLDDLALEWQKMIEEVGNGPDLDKARDLAARLVRELG